MSTGPFIPVPEFYDNEPWVNPREEDVIPVVDAERWVRFRIVLPFHKGDFTRGSRVFTNVLSVGTIGLKEPGPPTRTLAQLWYNQSFSGYVLTLHLPDEDGPSTSLLYLGTELYMERRGQYTLLDGPILEWMKSICEEDTRGGQTVYSPPGWAR